MGFQVTEVQKTLKGFDYPFTPDPLGHDEDVFTESEALDEDELGADPLEGGMDPPEGWSAATRYGTTPLEQATVDDEVLPGEPVRGEGEP